MNGGQTQEPIERPAGEALLRTFEITKKFAGLVAIENVSISVYGGEICGIIGPNGAGKSTLVGLLGGALTPSSGSIFLNGSEITTLSAAERARRGIGRTYQIPRPFLDMTVRENLLVSLFSIAPFITRREAQRRSDGILERTGLSAVAERQARDLQLVRRKRLELARALALQPKVLLLDEIGAGLVESEVGELSALIRSLAAEVDAIVIVEHVMRVVRECCKRLVVLNFGRQIAEGPTTEILASDQVASVYLGTQTNGPAQHGPISPRASTPGGNGSHVDGDTIADRQQHKHATPDNTLRNVVAPPFVKGRSDAQPVVSLQHVHAGYGQTRVLHAVDLAIYPGQTVAILGTNGAGKTTLARVISGMIRPSAGTRFISGLDATALGADRIARLGIAHCMEGRRIFAPLSVEENLLVAARSIAKAEQRKRLDVIYELFPILYQRRKQIGTAMSGGQQQMLAISRALMARPALVILDEVSLGLAPVMVERLYEALHVLRSAGLTMLVIEQNVDRALQLADTVHVLELGVIALSGSPAAIKSDSRLRHLYIGETDEAADEPQAGIKPAPPIETETTT